MAPRYYTSLADYMASLLLDSSHHHDVQMTSPVPVDLWYNEETKDFQLSFAVAGYPKENLHVRLEDGVLKIEAAPVPAPTGFTLQQGNTKKGKWHYQVRIPDRYNPEATEVAYQDGVLSITFHLREESKPKLLTLL